MNRPLKRRQNRKYGTVAKKPRIFTYSSVRNSRERPLNRDLQNEPPHKKPLSVQKNISKIVNYMIAAALICGAVYMCVLNPSAQIKINGEKIYPRDKTAYEQGVDEQLKSSILYRTKITFNNSELAGKIKDEFPEINNVEIRISPLRHRPIVELTLAKPAARLVTKDRTYILDEEGRALFDEKYASSGLKTGSLLTISDDSGHQIELGKPALTQAQIGFIREVIGQVSAKDLKPESFTLSRGGTALDVRFEAVAYFVKFSFTSDPKQSSGAFIALRQQLKRDNAEPKRYIDLRIPDKAFVR